MQCGNCGATIAEKAIACYRCGAPTAIPVTTRPKPPAPSVRPRVVVLVIVLVVVAAVIWLLV